MDENSLFDEFQNESEIGKILLRLLYDEGDDRFQKFQNELDAELERTENEKEQGEKETQPYQLREKEAEKPDPGTEEKLLLPPRAPWEHQLGENEQTGMGPQLPPEAIQLSNYEENEVSPVFTPFANASFFPPAEKTTIMLRGLLPFYSQKELIEHIKLRGFLDGINFIYTPISLVTGKDGV